VYKLRIAILGIGSIGGLFLGTLADSNVDLIAVSRGITATKLSRVGVILHTPEGSIETIPPDMFTLFDSESGPIPQSLSHSCDFALICGKANSTTILTQIADELLSNEGIAISIQNGLGHAEYIANILGRDRVLGCTITHGAWNDSESFHWVGRGDIRMGFLDGKPPSENIRYLISSLHESKLSPKWSDDIQKDIWIKLLINIAINPICAITGLRNGDILSIPFLWSQAVRSMEEASRIAKASGINIDDANLTHLLQRVIESTATNRCSMLQDIMSGRETEIDSLCGVIVSKGELFGIPTPLNSMLLGLIKGIEKTSNFK
tara:strand:+ start:490 stop:1449 length:960 start_codon:yes stop_codon:yes gene_type:complete